MDKVFIRDLLVRGIIGINDWERENKQDILVNVTMYTDLVTAGKSDNIEDTPNYRTVAKNIISHIERSKRFTVEALATELADICLSEDHVAKVQVRLEKPTAVRFSKSVGVEIERSKEK